jgi:hypothetical protein
MFSNFLIVLMWIGLAGELFCSHMNFLVTRLLILSSQILYWIILLFNLDLKGSKLLRQLVLIA